MSVHQRRERERAHRHQLLVTTARQLAEADGWDAVTVRRLAEQIEYSQPVLYSHFASRDAIVAAVAVQGFAELAAALQRSRRQAGTPEQAVHALARTYMNFADANPALYEAMFTLATDLAFGTPGAPAPLQDAFRVIRDGLAPLAGDRDPDTYAEVAWSALHGLVTLARHGRLRPGQHCHRLALLVDQLLAPPRHM